MGRLAELIARRVTKLYERLTKDSESCPGEQNCKTWRSSAPDVEVRCPNCPKLLVSAGQDARAPSEEGPETFEETQLLDRVDRLRQERNSGRAVYGLMDPLEWEALLIWDETLESWRRSHEIRTAQMFQMMMARFAAG